MGIAVSIKKAIAASERNDDTSRTNSIMSGDRQNVGGKDRKTALFVTNQDSHDQSHHGIQDESIDSLYGSHIVADSSMFPSNNLESQKFKI